MLRQIPYLSVLLAALLLPTIPALAADVEVRLAGGSVTGEVRGQGTATVEAQVMNHGASALLGVRLGVYYSVTDAAPGPGADWREHEFVFEPPLAPGESTTLSFTDESAAEFIALEVRYSLFEDGGVATEPDNGNGEGTPPETKPKPEHKPKLDAPASSNDPMVLYRGMPANLASPLIERKGAIYISTRDLMDCVGGSLGYDAATYQVILERKGRKLAVKTGERNATADDKAIKFDHAVLEIDGRSYLPLIDVAPYLALTAEASGKAISLEDTQ